MTHNGGGRPIQETGDNHLLGGAGADRLIGGDGDDDLRGAAGQDALVSLGGGDRLDGGSGDDTLVGMGAGAGPAAELTGGAGADTFVIAPQLGTSAGVTIKDFALVDDLINLDGVYTDASGSAVDESVFESAITDANTNFNADSAEIDLSQFFVEDPNNPDSYAAAEGTLTIQFQDNLVDGSFSSGEINYAENNPLDSETWWQSLLSDGGLI
jgi:Ca2+-binding RTX toxin-like protein